MEIKAALQLLELTAPFSKAVLKKAYRDALMVWHPDRFAGNTELKAKAEGRTYLINEAYALLCRIPESEYPYRASAGVQQAKQTPPPEPKRTSTEPPTRSETPQPQASPPPQRASAEPPNEPKIASVKKVKKKADVLTVAAWIICVPAAVFLIAFIVLLQSPKESTAQNSGSVAHKEERPVPNAGAATNLVIDAIRLKAQQGDKEAQFQLGKAYANGDGFVKDAKAAFQWFQSAADQGHDVAQVSVGECYASGHGISQNMVEAVKWYRKAAEQGNAAAQFFLGTCYSPYGCLSQDAVEAVKWYRKAAEQGHAAAQFNVGFGYEHHQGVPYDAVEAVKWYRKAAEQGFGKSQFRLGYCYAVGAGVSRDVVEAARWYRKAAEQGDAASQFLLGHDYATGKGVTKDMAEAEMWWRKAADQGDASAQIELGNSYANGNGVIKDMVEATKWWLKAADQGDAGSQHRLGICYANGDGVPKDLIQGLMWLNLAALNSYNLNGEQERLSLEVQMTASQINEARILAANSTPKRRNGQPKIEPTLLTAADPKGSMSREPALQHLPSDERLTTGSVLTDQLETLGGKGRVTLDNGLTEDAFVKMIDNEKLVASFYVRGGNRFTFGHVPDGIYKLIYCTGFGWDAGRRDFARGRHAVRYDELLNFYTTRTATGSTVRVITLTLHKVSYGNTKTSDIPLEEFDRY